ncbi:hypothetical protein HK405_014980, partial [Cladochytrium tenue]
MQQHRRRGPAMRAVRPAGATGSNAATASSLGASAPAPYEEYVAYYVSQLYRHKKVKAYQDGRVRFTPSTSR